MSRCMDVNCDMGEAFGIYEAGNDKELLNLVSSANIACGFHAGDPTVMRRTVRLCLERSVRIGAHPGLPDLQGFGRRAMALSAEEVYDLVIYQIGALQGIARSEGGTVDHIKPHGALYHMAEADNAIAKAIVRGVAASAPDAVIVGLSGGVLVAEGEAVGLSVRHEVFADRAYRRDGSLLPRTEPGSIYKDCALAALQAVALAVEGRVRAVSGELVSVRADTLCVHGDGPYALEHARAIYNALNTNGIVVSGGGGVGTNGES